MAMQDTQYLKGVMAGITQNESEDGGNLYYMYNLK